MKNIEEIEEEVAIDYGFSIWDSLFESYAMYDYGMLEQAINEVAQRYAQQYIDANKELVDMLEDIRNRMEVGVLNYERVELALTELINKHKQL